MSDNTTESEEVLFDLHRVSYPPTRCLCPLFERMLYIYHQLMQTVTWIDSLYRSGPCLPDLNILLSYVGSFYNDFLAGAKKIFNKHQNLFGEERKCCSPASALMTVFEKDRGASKDREHLKAQNKKNCPRNHRCFFYCWKLWGRSGPHHCSVHMKSHKFIFCNKCWRSHRGMKWLYWFFIESEVLPTSGPNVWFLIQ